MFKNLNLFRTKKQLEKQRYKTILVGEKITMTSYSREGFIFLKSREKANKSNVILLITFYSQLYLFFFQ